MSPRSCALCLLLLIPLGLVPSATHAVDLRDEVFYQIMPISWRDGDGDASRFGDFQGMLDSLDYLEYLGVTAVWLNPIFPSPAYHGYQHGAADQLNPWFGTESEWVTFVEAAHDRGIKVYLDFVVYGISHDSLWFQDAYANPTSIYDDWLAFYDTANTDYHGSLYTTWNGSSVGFVHWDLRTAAASQLVTDWAAHWLDPDGDGDFHDGVDGYRLDHVWETYPYGPDGWGYHLDTFWVPWRDALRQVNPDVRVFAEQADWGSFGAELLPGMDAAFTKPFEFSARDALIQEVAGPLESATTATVASLNGAPADRTYLATIGNHDVSRLATVIGDSFDKGRAAAAVLLTQPFPPVIYYGDEIGMRGAKDPGLPGDAADIPMREPFEWLAAEGPPMSRYHALNAPALAAQVARDFDGRSVQEQVGMPGSQLEAYRELIAARKASVALRRGDHVPVAVDETAVWSFVREHADQQVLVSINLSGQARTVVHDFTGFGLPVGGTTPVSLIDQTARPVLDASNQDAYALGLPAYGYEVLELSIAAPVPPPARADGRDLHGRVVATQLNPTDAGDDLNELDQMVVRDEGDGLVVGLGGNLGDQGFGVALFVDAIAGGQNLLDTTGLTPPPYGPHELTGLRFDVGFEPERLYFVNVYQGQLFVDEVLLTTGGGAVKIYRGQSTVDAGVGLLSGGTNPFGMEVALDDRNVGGVGELGVPSDVFVPTGLEYFLPWEDLTWSSTVPSSVGLAAVLIDGSGFTTKQWLPSLPAGSAAPGTAPDLRGIAGEQHVFVPIAGSAVSAPTTGPPRARLHAPAPNPFNPRTRIAYSLGADTGDHRLVVFDLAGRRIRTLASGPRVAGDHQAVWSGRDDQGRRVASGVYLVRLVVDGESHARRVVLVE